jgi:DNA polymerase III subunit gamma/tau
LSQKYRPKFFDELVGQGMVVKTLSMAILKDKVAPAYLFTGPSGTGKTTTARIFAAALNCLASESRPCGNCQQCGSRSHWNQGAGDSDVKEIDAASTNVDLATMRSSIMQQNFSSTNEARYKVFIVEGCHLLSTDIWNAFLKLLEEPPSSSLSSANVVFILITTESEQLPLTVISSLAGVRDSPSAN